MKTSLLLLLLAGGPLACLAANTPQPGGSPPFTWVDPADPAAAAIRQTGEQLISRVGNLLIFEVERGIAENGLIKTLEIVHLKDLALPKPAPGQPRVTAIKRTSLNLRSPANQPDAADRAALDKFNTAIHEGEVVPMVLIQRLEAAAAPVEWRVYRPITTMPQCLKCHGPREGLQPEIRDYLAQHYPADKAAGYAAYEWRGIIRVSLAGEPATPAKTK
jgi:Protein of unknown function (DUF3365)